ncbi:MULTISPECIES: type II toxin-antitoxin system Phd/YefM family antitoxin [unclassified Pantoea]|uniref:Antitoxin n=1 Tax=Pantoea sp. BJ2 TaxID=3141322 RepID=A0AAU7U293_9GAMM|nr:type II toxin-antitoxin system Phd/YefM family antitoxin [Pantoea sp. SO10]QCP61863.1 type II toxin-antitoxin system Phd/YefM family antitoxin [Pantoea sp. SO10]
MYSFTASEAKIQFGEVLNKATREPVGITKNGNPKFVIMSVDDYNALEAHKLENLRNMLTESIAASERGDVYTMEDVFSPLTAEEIKSAGE